VIYADYRNKKNSRSDIFDDVKTKPHRHRLLNEKDETTEGDRGGEEWAFSACSYRDLEKTYSAGSEPSEIDEYTVGTDWDWKEREGYGRENL